VRLHSFYESIMKQYCLMNNTGKAVSAFGIVIQPKSQSRKLSEMEYKRACKEAAPEGVSLVPFLLESEKAVVEAEQTPQTPKTTSGASRRGRKTEVEE